MNYLDWFFVFILGSGAVWGYQKGLIKAILGFLGIGLAIWIGFKFSEFAVPYVAEVDFIPIELVNLVAIVLTIILIYFAVKIIAKILHSITHTIGLGIFNRLGGVVFGILINLFMLGALVYYVLPFFDSMIGSEMISQSKLMPYLHDVIDLFKMNFHLVKESL
ncbi:CvpA family protein [Moheibacter lacus]|uniref:CvpA family protein n=1 Tax=Moheibacter lacus TaxID=2745851 RepID=A0A838ZJN9_9FLAO|nr:CvpA family protein [Moheibacter lacus]MBA5628574.1 CvpA family protein [Moheibacter lacus]